MANVIAENPVAVCIPTCLDTLDPGVSTQSHSTIPPVENCVTKSIDTNSNGPSTPVYGMARLIKPKHAPRNAQYIPKIRIKLIPPSTNYQHQSGSHPKLRELLFNSGNESLVNTSSTDSSLSTDMAAMNVNKLLVANSRRFNPRRAASRMTFINTPLRKCNLSLSKARIARFSRFNTALDFENPDSPIAHCNLRGLINKATFATLPTSCQTKLLRLLPELDTIIDSSSGIARIHPSALNNEFFTKALQEFRERLLCGEFRGLSSIRQSDSRTTSFVTNEDVNVSQCFDHASSSSDTWKELYFEEYWGQQRERMHKERLVAEAAASIESEVAMNAFNVAPLNIQRRRHKASDSEIESCNKRNRVEQHHHQIPTYPDDDSSSPSSMSSGSGSTSSIGNAESAGDGLLAAVAVLVSDSPSHSSLIDSLNAPDTPRSLYDANIKEFDSSEQFGSISTSSDSSVPPISSTNKSVELSLTCQVDLKDTSTFVKPQGVPPSSRGKPGGKPPLRTVVAGKPAGKPYSSSTNGKPPAATSSHSSSRLLIKRGPSGEFTSLVSSSAHSPQSAVSLNVSASPTPQANRPTRTLASMREKIRAKRLQNETRRSATPVFSESKEASLYVFANTDSGTSTKPIVLAVDDKNPHTSETTESTNSSSSQLPPQPTQPLLLQAGQHQMYLIQTQPEHGEGQSILVYRSASGGTTTARVHNGLNAVNAAAVGQLLIAAAAQSGISTGAPALHSQLINSSIGQPNLSTTLIPPVASQSNEDCIPQRPQP